MTLQVETSPSINEALARIQSHSCRALLIIPIRQEVAFLKHQTTFKWRFVKGVPMVEINETYKQGLLDDVISATCIEQ